jgi:hypothetical protein
MLTLITYKTTYSSQTTLNQLQILASLRYKLKLILKEPETKTKDFLRIHKKVIISKANIG